MLSDLRIFCDRPGCFFEEDLPVGLGAAEPEQEAAARLRGWGVWPTTVGGRTIRHICRHCRGENEAQIRQARRNRQAPPDQEPLFDIKGDSNG